MIAIASLLALLSLLASPASPATGPCGDHAAPGQRLACLNALELPPLPAGHLPPPSSERSIDPEWARVLRDRLERAERNGNMDEAARAAWLLAGAEDATGRIDWVGPDGRRLWSAAVDAGSGQLGRSARLLRNAGRADLAEPLLGRALRLGQSVEPAAGWDPATVAGLDPPTTEILATTWYLPLPPVTLPVIDGDPVRTADLLGEVLVLDFWASWCAPCRDELPRMQAFHEKNEERGLVTFAVNVGESRGMASSAAQTIGLELPLVEYDDELARVFDVQQLPTVVLIDRAGEIRGRWELFTEGTEERIFWAIDQMLELENTEGEAIAHRVAPGETLQVRWMREFRGVVDSVLPLPGSGDEARLYLSHGRTLLALRPDGTTEQKLTGDLTSGRLIATRPDEEGRYSLVSFRLGGTRISSFDLPTGEVSTWEAPAPVFDAEWVDPANPAAGIVLATLEGLVRVDGEGRPTGSVDVGLVRGLERLPVPATGDPGWVALTGTDDLRQWSILSSDLEIRSAADLPGNPWRLEGASSPGGFGLLSPSVKTVAVGRFFESGEHQVAAAGEGQLVIVEAETGKELFRARWEGIQALSGGDLDGDGIDELMVAWGRRMAVLGCPDVQE